MELEDLLDVNEDLRASSSQWQWQIGGSRVEFADVGLDALLETLDVLALCLDQFLYRLPKSTNVI